jgi:dipeptidyl aminopeptidase/acylaminoacyl peptidase
MCSGGMLAHLGRDDVQIRTIPLADPKRLGVTGGSGGGLLTNWAITHTDRSAAAVSQRSIADWSAWWYTADFTLYQPRWFRTPPFRGTDDYAARSPLTYVEKIKTPLMLIEGESDYRTPPPPPAARRCFVRSSSSRNRS